MKTTEEAIRHRHHRGIVALNNGGVGLMEKNCHRQASEVLRNAMAAMKMKILQSNDIALIDGCDVSPSLDRAARSIANPKPEKSRDKGSFTSIQVVSDRVCHRNLEVALKICQELKDPNKKNESAKKITAIRIELNDFEDTSRQDHDITLAVLMYNYGLTLRCLSSVAGINENSCKKLREAAVRLLAYASTLLTEKYRQKLEEGVVDYFQRTTMMFLATVVLEALYQSYIEAGMDEHAKSCLSPIQHLCDSLQCIGGSDLLGCIESTAPAA